MNEELERSWSVTRAHLGNARALLPSALHEFPMIEEGSLVQFEEYLENNELELALDELAGLGENNECPRAFWGELVAAAENMGLVGRASELLVKLEERPASS